MYHRLKKQISNTLLNIPGWRSKRKIIVIESDDWGTVRMNSHESWLYFLNKGYPVDKCSYNRYDSLESNEDMEKLFEVLLSVKDCQGNPAVITANNIVANPDFDKIKSSGFSQYFYEPFTNTLQRYPGRDSVADLYKYGIEQKIFKPQFHGREHVNVPAWMKLLQADNELAHLLFQHRMFSLHARHGQGADRYELMDALNIASATELRQQESIISDGLMLFEKIWGYQSKSIIAPCYIWSRQIEPVAAKFGVHYIQGIANQFEPLPKPGYDFRKIYHYQGQKNRLGQRYLVRNSFFEPAFDENFDWYSDCMRRIKNAFTLGKPAIICSHRLNYTGSIHPGNREKNLRLLADLLKGILKYWPEAEFMSSDCLGEVMVEKHG
ncbi:MAG TPA: hypothetical protein PKC39_01640 [Ferruginibacter sp.]|nr:hypothetical protein [Ferruginibacter sp.]HMP19637.1 hypothetical protein [Ferruginibacter sp.]